MCRDTLFVATRRSILRSGVVVIVLVVSLLLMPSTDDVESPRSRTVAEHTQLAALSRNLVTEAPRMLPLSTAQAATSRAGRFSEWQWPASSRPPPAPAVFGIGAHLRDLEGMRHEVEDCELGLAVIGNRFDSPRDVSKLKAFVMSAHSVREKYLVTHKDHMLDDLRAWLTVEYNWTVIDFADEDLYFADMISVEGESAVPRKHKETVKKLVGYALRMDLPRILSRNVARFRQPGKSACDRHVLYMDTDIALEMPGPVFTVMNHTLQKARPFLLSEMVDQYPTLAAVTTEYTTGWRSGIMPSCGEQRVDSCTGVMVMNIPALLATVKPFTRVLLQFVQKGNADALSATFDQTVFNHYYGSVISGIVDKMFGWRLLSGFPPMARALHFQGIKCESLLCDPPSGVSAPAVDSDGNLHMARINHTIPCFQSGVSWRKHDTHFMSKAVGGLENTRCAYEFACRRLFVDASTPWNCAEVADRPLGHSTGFGFRTWSVDPGRCSASAATCSNFRRKKRLNVTCAPSSTSTLVPPVLRQKVTPAMASNCSIAVALLLDHRASDPTAAERARQTVSSAARSGLATVLVVVIGASQAAADDALVHLQRETGDSTKLYGAALDVSGLEELGMPSDVTELAASAAVVVPAVLHSTGVLLKVEDRMAPYPCPSPLALVVEAGATVTEQPSLVAGQVFPLYAALRVRCPSTSLLWPLGATMCFARGIQSLHSSRLALVNLLVVAGVAQPALELARRLRSSGEGEAVQSSVDPLAAFIATAAVALPSGWGGVSCGESSGGTGGTDGASVVSLLPEANQSSGCGCNAKARRDGGAWPVQPQTLQNPECWPKWVCSSKHRPSKLAKAACSAEEAYKSAGVC